MNPAMRFKNRIRNRSRYLFSCRMQESESQRESRTWKNCISDSVYGIKSIPFVRSAFTIIELIMVIAIITILASLLLPVLRNARENTWRILCTSNLKQVAQVVVSYAGDSNGWTPKSDNWSYTFYNNGYIPQPIVGKTCILVCPTHFTKSGENRGVWAMDGRTYGMRYGFGYQAFNIFRNPVPIQGVVSTLSPTAFMLFADTNHSSSAIDYQWYIFVNYQAGDPVHIRHMNRCNAVFADAHADSLSRQQLMIQYNFIIDSIIR